MASARKAATPIEHHRNLEVWDKAMVLAAEVFRICRDLPASERWGLAQQMRRTAVSIPANIAEGKGRTHPRDFARFLAIARGSAYELDTYLELVRRLEYLARDEMAAADALLHEIRRMLTALLKRLTPL